MPTPPSLPSIHPRSRHNASAKYQPAPPPMRRMGANACTGGASTTARRLSILN
jgi:hypothetical protein